MRKASVPSLQKSSPSQQLMEAWSHAPTGHFCHMTALYFHGLTNQVPSRIYLRKRDVGSRKRDRPDRLSDLQIRTQFLKPHRRTENVLRIPGGEIVLIAGSLHDETGIMPLPRERRDFPEGSRITDLERCLIDAVVAPQYNGGLSSLPEIFENAADRLNPERLIAHYRELDFLYPFHQALGFFLDHSGQADAAEQLRGAFPPTNRFFVDRLAKTHWPFDQKWKVHYPAGLVNEH